MMWASATSSVLACLACSAAALTPASPVAYGSYTVKYGDMCPSIADSLCPDGLGWNIVLCNAGVDVCNSLSPGQILSYDCSGKGTHCSSPIEGYGSYTAKSGDICWNIADSLCHDGNEWNTVICNAADVCNNLAPGQVLSYDCSGKGTHCSSPIEGHGSYTVKDGDMCQSIAESLCQDGNNDWNTVICNGADVCNFLSPGQVLNYDCSGKGAYCSSPIEGHGSYTVKSGDMCWSIADSLCHGGNEYEWNTVICSGADVCNSLVPGQVLNYDCSGKGTYCKGPIEAATQIMV